ncbi:MULTISPECIES: LacI family DNA-binding transcriptional regulator [Alteromonadaceae]|uniref:LacI family DNA-binding transcriptional regulator n=1 Tax=Alteromonadaceae TaxID=72275 RepID=UPI001C0951B6|nr:MULTISPECIES: LacI family DNA-binding transcriptional regulator [Aliiglaciecola]MBU2877366.1 LacI family transcriptional regulator [Aliiglaciecola lipolytica]MDO6713014.1 LacI family DNA-binding transcriptional regulator [Aliiglaciecola sp. 2_MG-2023]MDO6754053.1 LacI family DNA-binding transcriptional regulator [Aliiglaciecola sp. 1_MG-2023]
MAKTKLIDVAERAGVSNSTVSQYLNGRFDYMSEKTKERIKIAVSELDYVPNPIARSLKMNKTKTIGVIVRDITGFYTSRTIRGIDDFCKTSEYNLLIYNTDVDPKVEAKSLETLYQLRVDGIIIASSGKNTDLINRYSDGGLPIVHFQLEHDGNEKNIIISDYRKAAFEATEYLIQLGHKRICFVTQDFKHVKSRKDRYLGYSDALQKHGIPLDEQLIQYWRRETGFEHSPTSLLDADNPPTVFFTQHLAITTDILTALNAENISIPDDVSILGFDDIPMADFFKVPITVITQNPYEIGRQATKLLLNNINNKEPSSEKIMIPCSLIKRLSCKQI